MPPSKPGAGESQIVDYWWLGARSGRFRSWVKTTSPSPRLIDRRQAEREHCAAENNEGAPRPPRQPGPQKRKH